MIRLAILLGLVAFCAAKSQISHCCSAEDRNIVQEQWKALWRDTDSSKVKIGFSRLIVLKLVELHPETKELFANVNIDNPDSGEFKAYCMRFLNSLDTAINLLDYPEALNEILGYLAQKIVGLNEGVKREHFKAIGQIILGQGLPRVLDEYDVMSWKSCFKGIFTRAAAGITE